jgi:adenylate kinase family enzyme
MRKVLVLGCSGAGKSTFSRQLGEIMDIPIIHLDALYWKAGWIQAGEGEFDSIIDELLVKRVSFIMDGNYSRTLNKRLALSDTIYFFDFSRYLCLYRVIKRRIQNHRRTRSDMAEGCPEKIDWEFIKWIWSFKKRSRSKILKALDEAKRYKVVHIFRNPREVKAYIHTLSK